MRLIMTHAENRKCHDWTETGKKQRNKDTW